MRWMSAAPLAVLVLALGCPADSSFTNIEVVENPNNALSCIVRFTAAESGPGAVEFGAGDDPAFAVRDRLKDVDHELVVIGMRPETTYKLWLVSTPDFSPEARSEPIEYTTGAVPFDDLVLEQTAYVAAEMQPGWTLTNVSVGSNMYPATAVILDQEGVPVWYHRMSDTPGRADVDVRMCGDETICIGGSLASFDPPVELDLAGNPVWTGPAQPDVTNLMTPGEMHHHFTRMDDGGYQILRLQVEDGWAYDEVEELDEAGEVVWSWHGEGDLVGKVVDYP